MSPDGTGVLKSKILECAKFNLRHTSQNLKEDIERVTQEFGIEEKHVHSCVDNANNIKKAASSMDTQHDGCAGHKFNLTAKDTIKDCLELLALEKKMNGTIKFTRISNEGKKYFQKCQEWAGFEGKKYCILYF